jgi:hypothetical protein
MRDGIGLLGRGQRRAEQADLRCLSRVLDRGGYCAPQGVSQLRELTKRTVTIM